MNLTSNYTSYLVRLWQQEQEGDEGQSPSWQGELLHIQSGHKTFFQDKEQLLRYLLEQLAEFGDPTTVHDE